MPIKEKDRLVQRTATIAEKEEVLNQRRRFRGWGRPRPGLALVVAGPGDWHLVAIPLVQVCQRLVVAAARPLVA